jgi:tRNA (guanine26-N2/guanine27-N2)-dimethyltransferase
MTERVNDRSGNTTVLFKTHVGPPVSEKCPECGSSLHIAGPMWNGPIHDSQFVGEILEHLEGNEDKYGTSTRMKGMLTVAKEVGHFDTFHDTCPAVYRGT